jgi:hypothetical protein
MSWVLALSFRTASAPVPACTGLDTGSTETPLVCATHPPVPPSNVAASPTNRLEDVVVVAEPIPTEIAEMATASAAMKAKRRRTEEIEDVFRPSSLGSTLYL